MRLNFTRLQMAALSTSVAFVSSLAQLRVQDHCKKAFVILTITFVTRVATVDQNSRSLVAASYGQ